MKKHLTAAIALPVAAALLLTACGKDTSTDNSEAKATATTTTSSETSTTTSTATSSEKASDTTQSSSPSSSSTAVDPAEEEREKQVAEAEKKLANYGGMSTEDFKELPETINSLKRTQVVDRNANAPMTLYYSGDNDTEARIQIDFIAGKDGVPAPITKATADQSIDTAADIMKMYAPGIDSDWTEKVGDITFKCASNTSGPYYSSCVTTVAGRLMIVQQKSTSTDIEAEKTNTNKFLQELGKAATMLIKDKGFDESSSKDIAPLKLEKPVAPDNAGQAVAPQQ